jgi:hypothetical protein
MAANIALSVRDRPLMGDLVVPSCAFIQANALLVGREKWLMRCRCRGP